MAKASVWGYPKKKPNGEYVLTDGEGREFGRGVIINTSRVRPGAPGAWISNERTSYRFVIDGEWYSCRGRGEGISASCRKIKQPRVGQRWGLGRAKRRRR